MKIITPVYISRGGHKKGSLWVRRFVGLYGCHLSPSDHDSVAAEHWLLRRAVRRCHNDRIWTCDPRLPSHRHENNTEISTDSVDLEEGHEWRDHESYPTTYREEMKHTYHARQNLVYTKKPSSYNHQWKYHLA